MNSLVSLEARVALLESAVERLASPNSLSLPPKDWRQSVGKFGGDGLMKEIDREGAAIREQDRKAAAKFA